MTNKEKRRLRKEKKQRERYEKMKRNEYSSEYLKAKDKIGIVESYYPKTRLVLLRDFLKSKDLHKAVVLFLGSQLSILLLLISVDYPQYAPIIGIFSILAGLICVILSIKEINKRQALDRSREPVNFKLVFKIVLVTLITTSIIPIILSKFGILLDTSGIQPNQEVVDSILALFPIPMIFTTIIVAPIIEEVIFRELLPHATGPSYLSFIITSILFIIVHSPSGIIGWTTYGITSFAFLYARLKNSNVYSAIAAHFIWNILSLVL